MGEASSPPDRCHHNPAGGEGPPQAWRPPSYHPSNVSKTPSSNRRVSQVSPGPPEPEGRGLDREEEEEDPEASRTSPSDTAAPGHARLWNTWSVAGQTPKMCFFNIFHLD